MAVNSLAYQFYSTKGYQYSMLRCHILLTFVWNTDKSSHARKNFQIHFVFIFSTYHYFPPYRYKLDLADPVRQNQQQIRRDIHTCTSQRCYCKLNWLHKHLGTGTHQHLNISTHHKLTNIYYYRRNFCNLIGLEQWYFSLI